MSGPRVVGRSVVSKSTGRKSICFTVPANRSDEVSVLLRAAFASELARRDVDDMSVRAGLTTVAVVGSGMASTPGIAARTFCALSRDNVNIIAIAQGSSESNISFLVPQKDMRAALIATHREFLNGSHSEVSSATGV